MPSPAQDLELVTNPAVHAALVAWQGRDSARWQGAFVSKPTLTDDGAPRDFAAFSSQIGNEYFTAIDEVSLDGLTVIGQFHSKTWGDFRTYFHFVPGREGKFEGLDIGQA